MFTVTILIGSTSYTREIRARSALNACRSAARSGGFSAREIDNGVLSGSDHSATLWIREGVMYSADILR